MDDDRRLSVNARRLSNTVRLAVALALTAVTATGALAASQHRGAYPSAYSGYANSLDAAYGAPARGWAYKAYWGAYGAAETAPIPIASTRRSARRPMPDTIERRQAADA